MMYSSPQLIADRLRRANEAQDGTSIPMRCTVTLIFLIATLTGCARTANYEIALNSWLGMPAEDLVRVWGPPSSIFQLADGHEVYIYERPSGVYITPPQIPETPAASGRLVPVWCRTEFEVSSGRILRWSWRGDSCRAGPPSS
jgi:hypothetical protein